MTQLDIYYFSGDNRADEPVTVGSAAALDDVLVDILANPQPHPTVVYAKDRPTVGPMERPDHQVKFDVDPERQVGAVHAFGPGDFAPDPSVNDVDETTAWIAQVKGFGGQTSASLFSDVTLYIDKDTRTEFTKGALLPLAVLRELLHEFMRTGKRPVCVDWEQTDVF
ncbi:MAG: Imm1 family immunity protein [Umezawaea sp.]